MNFCNYVQHLGTLLDIVDAIEKGGDARVAVIGFGPTTRDLVDIDNFSEFATLNGSQRRAKILNAWKDYHAKI